MNLEQKELNASNASHADIDDINLLRQNTDVLNEQLAILSQIVRANEGKRRKGKSAETLTSAAKDAENVSNHELNVTCSATDEKGTTAGTRASKTLHLSRSVIPGADVQEFVQEQHKMMSRVADMRNSVLNSSYPEIETGASNEEVAPQPPAIIRTQSREINPNDPRVIKEQLAILEQIASSRETLPKTKEDLPALSTQQNQKSLCIPTNSSHKNILQKHSNNQHTKSVRSRKCEDFSLEGGNSVPTNGFTQTHLLASKESLTPNGQRKLREMVSKEGKEVVVYPGQNAKIRAKQYTLDSIAKGTATIVQCASCSTHLQVNRNAKVCFCPRCGALSPTELRLECHENKQSCEKKKVSYVSRSA